MKKRKKVLLLGAAGRIGTGFQEEYLKKYKRYYDLILGVHSKKSVDKNFKTVKFSLTNINSLKKAMRGVSVVINLAANPSPNAKFEDILQPNIVGAYNVFEAARQSGCIRVVFASSIHAVKGYSPKHKIGPEDGPKPINFYGASKALGEALCNVFSKKYGLSCLAIRIGAYVSDDRKRIVCFTRHDYEYVISQGDMGQLFHKSIMAPKKVKYGILSETSNNKHQRLELGFTKKLIGYNPKDDAFAVCKAIKLESLKKK